MGRSIRDEKKFMNKKLIYLEKKCGCAVPLNNQELCNYLKRKGEFLFVDGLSSWTS